MADNSYVYIFMYLLSEPRLRPAILMIVNKKLDVILTNLGIPNSLYLCLV